MKIKNVFDSLAAIGEPMTERNQILQLLGGLGSDYDSIVTSLTTREDDISLHLIYSIPPTHEQQLCFQNTIPKIDLIAANMATTHHRNNNNGRNNNITCFSQNKNGFGQRLRRHPPNGRGKGNPNTPTDRLQCQLCGKYGHTMIRCYHRFDINFQGYHTIDDPFVANKYELGITHRWSKEYIDHDF